MSKQNVYDNNDFFENFQSSRSKDVNFNDCIETPILFGMLPDLHGKKVLDIGCGMGQHAKQYSEMGAESVLGIDLSEKILQYAQEHNSSGNITYQRMAMEDIDTISETFDLVTSSLVFDYAEDFPGLMQKIHHLMKKDAEFVFSMSHPIVTAWDGVYDRYTRTETGERLYANLRNYCKEGLRKVDWVVNGYECYHRTVSSLINGLIGAGFMIEECQEAHLSDEMRAQYPALFDGTIHRPEFIFFRCRKNNQDVIASSADRVIVVSHGTTISFLQSMMAGQSVEDRGRFRLNGSSGSISRYTVEDSGRVTAMYLNAHVERI